MVYRAGRGTGITYTGYAQYLVAQSSPAAPKPPTILTPIAPAPATASPATPPTVAGIEPQAFDAILYGKDIPLWAGGRAMLGGRLIEGPWFGGTETDPTVSFVAHHGMNITSHAFQYDKTQVKQARLRGQEVWNSGSGYIATDKLPPGSFEWRPGHNAQPPFAQSVDRFGDKAIGYRQGIVSSWTDIPLKPFGGIIPFPSVLVETSLFGDPSDGIPREDAIKAVLGVMQIPSDMIEVDVKGSDSAWIVANNMTLEEFLKQLRSVFVNFRITYTDKLRIFEPTSFSRDWSLTNDNILRDTLTFRRADPLLTSREKQYTFIDVDRDYEMNTVSAKEDRFPVPTTDSVVSTRIELPIVTTSTQAMADLHVSLYEEMAVRNQMDGVGNVLLFGMEVGDGIRFADDADIDFFSRVMETTHDFSEWTVDFKSGEVLNCGAEVEEIDEFSAFPACSTRWRYDNWTVNFGMTVFAFTPPSGFFSSKFKTATWNPPENWGQGEGMFLSNNNMTASQGPYLLFSLAIRATKGTLTGKFYFEATWQSTLENMLGQGCGIARPFIDMWRWSLYGQHGGVFVSPDGGIYINGLSTPPVAMCGDIRGGGIRCIAVDMDAHRFWARANDGIWNNSPTADPATGIEGIDITAAFPGPAAALMAADADA